MSRQGDIVILGGARDYHAVDWYRTVRQVAGDRRVRLLTDTIEGEGFQKIVSEDDEIERLFVVDRLLLRQGSRLADKWRNLLKLAILPLQVYFLRRFVAKNPSAVLHAHPMYYMFLCWAARVKCGVTPQGSEILVRPYRSRVYGYFAKKSLQAASFVTVDSMSMKDGIHQLSGVEAIVVQNGIDTESVRRYAGEGSSRSRITSIRGFTPLYRIRDIVDARNRQEGFVPLTFVYPFMDSEYHAGIKEAMGEGDQDLGRLGKEDLYRLLGETFLTLSIPESDSSPRSVYEAIFAGSCVAASYNPYMEALPECMRGRIFPVNLGDEDWFGKALDFAEEKRTSPYLPSEEAVARFDQVRSLRSVVEKIYG